MTRTFTITLALLIFFLAVSAPSCQPKPKEPVKPNQLIVLAQTSAVIPIGIETLNEIVTIRARYGFDAKRAHTLIQATDRVLSIVDNTRAEFAAGRWDQATVRRVLKLAAEEFKQAVSAGAGPMNAQTRAEWIAWTTAIIAAIESAYELAEVLKPLPATIQGHDGQRPPAGITATEISEIVAISIPASIKVIGIYRQQDISALWAKGEVESAACHRQNKQRLAELSSVPTVLPKKKGK